VRHWFDALAELEALLSWACLAHDHPDWCFPELERDGTPRIQAAGLGHPLLPDATRVVNDVEVGPAGTVLLVTGSNMSGKSTLLRSIGLNAMLAEAGSPVCARRLQLPPLTVATSMRIQDSLQDGVSFFMAELQRLKSIVDLATLYQTRQDRTLLFLLDEVLQGTNWVERHLAVARVLAHLVAKGAIGAASTHDLELARSPQLVHCCRAVHFRETLHSEGDRQRMTFDYRLREGIATTSNALKLLEMVGLTEA
jgi:DNA mismatch repair ATPase MutS